MSGPTGDSNPSAARNSSGTFVRDTLIVAVTHVLMKVRGIIAMPLILKVFGTAAFGVWSQVAALTSLLGSLSVLNLQLPLVRDIASDRSRAAPVFTSLFLMVLGLGLVLSLALAIFATPVSQGLLGHPSAAGALRAGAALVALTAVRSINLNLFRAVGRFGQRAIIDLVISFGEILVILAVTLSGGSLTGVLLSISIWEMAILAYQTVLCFRLTGFATPSVRIIISALAFSLPAVPASLSVWVLDRIDRFVIGTILGADAVGIYSAAYTLAAAVLFLQLPLQVTLFPKVSSLWDTHRDEARRYVAMSASVFLALGVPFVALLPFLAEHTLLLLGNREVASQSGFLATLIAGGSLLWGISTLQMQTLLAGRRSKPVAVVTGLGAALNLLLNLALVPVMGLLGSAVATLLSQGTTCVAFALASDREDRGILWSAFAVRTLTAGFGMAFASAGTLMLSGHRWVAIVCGILAYLGLHLLLGRVWASSRPGWPSPRILVRLMSTRL